MWITISKLQLMDFSLLFSICTSSDYRWIAKSIRSSPKLLFLFIALFDVEKSSVALSLWFHVLIHRFKRVTIWNLTSLLL